jgi:hypothetical protein
MYALAITSESVAVWSEDAGLTLARIRPRHVGDARRRLEAVL